MQTTYLIITTILFGYLGSVIGRYFFFLINKEDFYYFFKKDPRNSFIRYLLFSFIPKQLRHQVTSSKYQKFSKKNLFIYLSLFSEVLGALTFSIFSFEILEFLEYSSKFSSLIALGVFVVSVILLLYLGIFDLISYSIPAEITKKLLIFSVGFNVFIGVIRFISSFLGNPLFQEIQLGKIDNLLSAIFFGGLMWLIVKISKEKAMGEGDVDLMLISGLLLGWPNTLIAFISMLLVASLFSLLLSLILKKFKDVIIPLVPFIVLGFVIALSFGEFINSQLLLF